jgi:hypothetical protein
MFSPACFRVPLTVILLACATAVAAPDEKLRGGTLCIVSPEPNAPPTCPLKHTDVRADVAGFLARVTVTQQFINPLQTKIEAVYAFPLPQDAAVDEMLMTVGDRRIYGKIKERDEARQVYEAAKAAGHVASLLDQERPNIFTQSVANIEPGATVTIEISYVETLKFDDVQYEWTFPMVVGPRYIPGGGSAPAPMTNATPTPQVPDAHKISAPVTPEGTRAGHDISISVNLESGPGMQLAEVRSPTHEIAVQVANALNSTVELAGKNEIPNKDFVLQYRLASDAIGDTYVLHEDTRGRFITLVLQPPPRIEPQALMPRELIFVLDTSGSMSGFPIEKAKQVMSGAINNLRPGDTFNLITFAGDTHVLWNEPRPATPENIAAAQKFLASRQGGGGTEMMRAIEAALVQTAGRNAGPRPLTPVELADLPADGRSVTVRVPLDQMIFGDKLEGLRVRPGLDIRCLDDAPPRPGRCGVGLPSHQIITGTWVTQKGERMLRVTHYDYEDTAPIRPIRVVCFMTDGYVGNDFEIIDAVKKNAATTRVFSFGIGSSVNRFLLDGMAHAGRGEVEYVLLESDAEAAVNRFRERIDAPVLTDVAIDWGTLPVEEVFPRQLPDLFSVKPLVIHARLGAGSGGTLTIRGNTGTGPFLRQVVVNLPPSGPHSAAAGNPAVPSLWARAKVADLMMRDMKGLQSGQFPADLKAQVIALGLEYGLMTQFTSFVAVEELTVTSGGKPITVQVPVEMPAGVSYQGVFSRAEPTLAAPAAPARVAFGASLDGRAVPGLSVPAAKSVLIARERLADSDADGVAERAIALTPAEKLAEPLRDLGAKVQRDGKDGNLELGKLSVAGWKIDVIVELRDVSDRTRAELAELGFSIAAELRATAGLIGSIDVRKLEELAKLEVVIRVKPVAG